MVNDVMVGSDLRRGTRLQGCVVIHQVRRTRRECDVVIFKAPAVFSVRAISTSVYPSFSTTQQMISYRVLTDRSTTIVGGCNIDSHNILRACIVVRRHTRSLAVYYYDVRNGHNNYRNVSSDKRAGTAYETRMQ